MRTPDNVGGHEVWTDAGREPNDVYCIGWRLKATPANTMARTLQGQGWFAEVRIVEYEFLATEGVGSYTRRISRSQG